MKMKGVYPKDTTRRIVLDAIDKDTITAKEVHEKLLNQGVKISYTYVLQSMNELVRINILKKHTIQTQTPKQNKFGNKTYVNIYNKI
jgi:Fe2+ or Zn2+ uptake regulation protein